MSSTHTQCKLQRGESHYMAWLPTKFAKKGKYVKIKKNGLNFEDGWLIVEAYSTLDSEYIARRSRDHLHQREASDI